MENSSGAGMLAGAARRLAHRLLTIGENRFQLLMAEVEEERHRLLATVFLGITTAALGLLCGIAWSAALVLFFWPSNPAVALLILGAIYCAATIVLCRRLSLLRRHPPTLAATFGQLEKDRACLKSN